MPRNEFIWASIVSLFLRGLGAVIAFVLSLVVARNLGAEQAGVFFLALGVMTICSTFARLGFDQPVTRLVSAALARKDYTRIHTIYWFVVLRIVFAAGIIGSVIAVLSPTLGPVLSANSEMPRTLQWMALAIIGFSVTWIHSHFFQGIEAIKLFQVAQNTGIMGAFLVITLLLQAAGFTAWQNCRGYAVVFAGVCILSAVVVALIWKRCTQRFPRQESPSDVDITWYELSVVFLAISTLWQLYLWLPVLMLGMLSETEGVGVYHLAARTANVTSLALVGVNCVVFPKFSALFESGDLKALERLAEQSMILMVIISLPFLLLLIVFAEWVLGLSGSEFVKGAGVLRVMVLAQIANVCTGSVGGLLAMSGNQRSALWCNVWSFVLLLSLALVLIPIYSIWGAAIAQAIGLVANMVLLSWMCHRELGFSPVLTATRRLWSRA